MFCRAGSRRLLFLLLLAPGCGRSSTGIAAGKEGLRGKLVLTGSSTVAPLAGEIARRFEELHPGVRVDVQSGGSSRGIADARAGTADIGMASRNLEPDEALDLEAYPIARDGVCLIVHRDNPVAELTDARVREVFTGQIGHWRELGGPDQPITVVHKAEGRATLEVFLAHFGLVNSEIRADVVIGDNEQGIKTVAGLRGAIGYVSIGAAEVAVARDVAIRLLPVGGVAATTANVHDGTFPLSRSLHLLTRRPASQLAQAFLEFAQSAQVHDLVLAQSFVPATR